MKSVINVNYDPANCTLTDAQGIKWVPLATTVFTLDQLIHIASSCSHMTGLMDAVEKEMLKAFEEGESK